MPDHALELSFDPDSTAAVVAQWEALRAAGLPSQADHRSMTNAPHLTVVAAAGIERAVVEEACDLVGPLLPSRVELRGLLVLGQGTRVTLAHLAEPDDATARAAARLRDRVPGVRHPVWTPHVTLARRVPRHLLPRALEVLDDAPGPRTLVCDRLRWWDPDAGVVEDVAGPGAGGVTRR
ncbi:2'-5' RNA ligase family protein [Nocardioides solisilvae]|uniref:2'-5' RNA ligase family protein n=1 Tax=Nocardioides solisilvae TaxID=1542435 RepID=UPI000D74048A|nr:2'-5' RNA ligase family protein [Nocardioides solisilvae]